MSDANNNITPVTPNPVNPTPTTSIPQWGQVTGGAAAVAFPAMMKLMAILNEIMSMYNQQASTQLKTQSMAALAGANATVSAANAQASQTICEATNSFAGAATSVYGMVHTSLASKPIQESLDSANTDKAGLDNLQQAYTKIKIASPRNAAVGPDGNPAPASTRVQTRINELLSGGHGLVEASKKTDFATEGATEGQSLNEAALSHMAQSGDLDEFSKKLTSAQDNNAKAINDGYTSLQRKQSEIQMNQSLVTGITGGISQALSSHFQVQAGQNQAIATLANSNAQQAGSMASNSQGLISKFYDEEMQALSMLQQLASSASSVRG